MVFDKNQIFLQNSKNKKIKFFLFTLNVLIFIKKHKKFSNSSKKTNFEILSNFTKSNGNGNDYLYLAF